MHTVELGPENFVLFAAKRYNNPSCMGMREFENDLKRFKYIKRLLKRYKKTKVISERLLLNHLILLHNVFGEAILPMLFYKIEEQYWSQLKTFLVFLNYLPDNYPVTSNVNEIDIPLDSDIVAQLRKL